MARSHSRKGTFFDALRKRKWFFTFWLGVVPWAVWFLVWSLW